MNRARIAVLVLAGVGLLAGCGGDGDGFSVLRADGTELAFDKGFDVFCGPWEDDVARPSLHVESPPRSSLREGERPNGRFYVSAVLKDIERSPTVRFPHTFDGSDPSKAVVFVADGKTNNETASDQEEASGTLVVRSYSCEDRTADLEFEDVVLGSEYFEGESVTVRGRLRVRG